MVQNGTNETTQNPASNTPSHLNPASKEHSKPNTAQVYIKMKKLKESYNNDINQIKNEIIKYQNICENYQKILIIKL